uniref:Phytanoyl-CoA dioxygenase domain-containing protein 1 n=1 Tax=Amphiprion ocellaris TaxID=80972 RepID=A0A3Q1AM22_AMPOC
MTTSATKLQENYNQQGFLSALPVLNGAELREARQYPWVMGLTKHPCILEVVKAILGPDVILLDSRFICKYPTLKAANIQEKEENKADESKLPYVYWGIAGGPVLSVWLALDDSLKENGALQVIPGSHCSGMLLHRQAVRPGNMLSVNQEIPEELVQVEEAVLCLLSAGQMSIHDGLLVQASDANTSQRRRCGFVIRYFPTCDPDRPRKFHATMLVSGTDQFNHFSNKST